MTSCYDCGKELKGLAAMWGDNGHILCGDCMHNRKEKEKENMEKLFWAYSPFPSGVVEMLKSKPMDDERHEVSDKMLKNKKKMAYAQDDFGMNKYGEAINSSMNYNWLDMIREELADADKYLECEAERKEKVLGLLELAMVTRNWRTIEHAYAELGKTGTGKEKTAK